MSVLHEIHSAEHETRSETSLARFDPARLPPSTTTRHELDWVTKSPEHCGLLTNPLWRRYVGARSNSSSIGQPHHESSHNAPSVPLVPAFQVAWFRVYHIPPSSVAPHHHFRARSWSSVDELKHLTHCHSSAAPFALKWGESAPVFRQELTLVKVIVMSDGLNMGSISMKLRSSGDKACRTRQKGPDCLVRKPHITTVT